MLLQLDPPLPLLTPKGPGLAHFLLDYGPEFDIHWTVFLDDSGECWTFNNREIRAQKNLTLGRNQVTPPAAAAPDARRLAAQVGNAPCDQVGHANGRQKSSRATDTNGTHRPDYQR